MIVDGARIAQEIDTHVNALIRDRTAPPRLRVLTCQPTFTTKRFLALKKDRAATLGVSLSVEECAPEHTTDEVVTVIKKAVGEADGIIVQLPFPPHIALSSMLEAIPASRDVDAIGLEAERLFAAGMPLVLPPVVGAIAEIIKRYAIEIAGKRVVVVGEGRLVGAPASVWFRRLGAQTRTFNRKTKNIGRYTREADMLVLGVGASGLIKPDMVGDGVIIFDAGTSEDTGKLVGDADPACAEKASLFTPVPGGIGPITVALIFKDLLTLIEGRKNSLK